MNTVKTLNSAGPREGKVSDFPGGTLVEWENIYDHSKHIFVVLSYKNNTSCIGAVSLEDGGYLNPTNKVTKVPIFAKLEIEVTSLDGIGS